MTQGYSCALCSYILGLTSDVKLLDMISTTSQERLLLLRMLIDIWDMHFEATCSRDQGESLLYKTLELA